MTVVFERPYEFVPPHRGNLWPTMIQKLRLVDFYLAWKQGVKSFECRGLDSLRDSIDRGDGIVLTPNHCRYSDPLVLGWPARELQQHVYAMASWHLFNTNRFDPFAIRRMGGFSIFREGPDRQSLQTAIEIIATAERPLVLFPEGTTNRTNDVLKPLMDGVTFIARSAARRRAKSNGRVVIHPVAIKYLCKVDVSDWANKQISEIEQRIGWSSSPSQPIRERLVRVTEGLLALREIEFVGETSTGDLRPRRDRLIELITRKVESRLGISEPAVDMMSRMRAIRTEIGGKYFQADPAEQQKYRDDVRSAELAQDLFSYPDCYLMPNQVTDTRVVETIQRMQETLYGKAVETMPLHAVIQFDESIDVPCEKAPRGCRDPLLEQVRVRLESMLCALSDEARPIG